MKPFSVLANLVTNTDGSRTVEYSVFAPGKRIKEKTVTQTQVTTCGSDSVPGIKIEVEFEEVGPGSPFSFDGFINVNSSLVLDSTKPYIEFKAVDGGGSGSGMIVRTGNGGN